MEKTEKELAVAILDKAKEMLKQHLEKGEKNIHTKEEAKLKALDEKAKASGKETVAKRTSKAKKFNEAVGSVLKDKTNKPEVNKAELPTMKAPVAKPAAPAPAKETAPAAPEVPPHIKTSYAPKLNKFEKLQGFIAKKEAKRSICKSAACVQKTHDLTGPEGVK